MSQNNNAYCKCLYYSANALARIISRIAEEEFAAVDLSPSYAFIIMTVNDNPGIHAGKLAEIMMLKPSTVTRLIEKLEKRKLLKRHTDGRITLINPTKKSLLMHKTIKASWHNLYKRYIKIIGEKEASGLTDKIFNAALKLEKE
jgi:DNA-binding MarR family transcriptional regulator